MVELSVVNALPPTASSHPSFLPIRISTRLSAPRSAKSTHLRDRLLCIAKSLGSAMRDLDKALDDIITIRIQIARSSEFRGYGPATVAATGVLAMLAAVVQALWIPDPATDVPSYLALWVTTAL